MARKNQGAGPIAIATGRPAIRLAFLSILIALAIFVTMPAAADATGGLTLKGVNISGGEFNLTTVPGIYNTNYVYPSTAELDYFSSKGMTVVRVPFSWERMQPSANGPLDPTELSRMDSVVGAANARGLSVILDPHNYGAYHNTTVGTPGGLPNSMFADFWGRLASHYASNPKVIFGLMNEPVGSNMTATTWLATAQAAINSIRSKGAGNLILVPATYWMHPVNYLELNASVMINITDPGNNYSLDVHQYFDFDGSGTHRDCMSPTDAVATLSGFTSWLRQNNRTAFLSEFGVTSDPNALAALDAILKYMEANKDRWTGWTYWTAGAWYPVDYMFSVEPRNGTDTPQMTVLIANLGSTTTPPPPEPTPTPTPTPTPPPPETSPPKKGKKPAKTKTVISPTK